MNEMSPIACDDGGRTLSPDELRAALEAIGAERYHNLHPFHRLLHDGKLSRGQVQAWALNRYYYQSRIPAKDATLLARLPTADLRRAWRSRLEDHDGHEPGKGGVARWLHLARGVGLDPAYVESTAGVSGMLRNYDWVSQDTLAYFTPRLTQAPKDVDFALSYIYEHATTRALQEGVLAALRFKCDVLWSQLDALHYAYVEPGRIPPGAFVPAV